MQLKYTSLFLMAFLVIASAQTFGQEKDLLSAEYSKCIEQSGGTDPGMLDCMGAEAERQDKRLNDAYKKLMQELKPERKKQLQEAQRIPNERSPVTERPSGMSELIAGRASGSGLNLVRQSSTPNTAPLSLARRPGRLHYRLVLCNGC